MSMRETLKALNATLSPPTIPYPLPEELRATIAGFLEKYDEIDDADSQRFHDDLLALYTRHVAGSLGKLGVFLSILRAVRPALTGEARLGEWWDLVLKPTIDSVGHKRHEVEDAKELLQSLLLFEADEDKNKDKEHARLSSLFLKKTLEMYLARTKVPSMAEDIVSPEDDHVSNEVESVLVAFGRKKPKELLLAVDELFVQKRYRTQALILLNAFVRLQTPHLYVVLETQLIQHLEKCLLIDTSSVVGQALVVLIMFLPHITSSLTSDHHLPRLFLIYSRLLCWDKFGNPDNTAATEFALEEDVEDGSEEDSDPTWDQLRHSADCPDTSPPTALLHYFTFLYGLFPLNFMSFIRKPRKLLKSMNFPGADDFDLNPDLLHNRTEPYRRVHLMHPNMFSTTIEDEFTENRWLDSDPADVVMDCMELCVAVSTTLDDPGPPPTTKLPDIPVPPIPESDFSLDDGTTANESAASWRNTQSTMFASSTNSQPDLSESSELPGKAKYVKSVKPASPLLKIKDVIESPTLPPAKEAPRKQSFLSAPTAAPQRLNLQTSSADKFAQIVSVPGSPTQPDFHNLSMAALQREIMLLRNDLNFERYLKAQHIAHIGQMQRKHIKEATAEADTQNLINTNKTLKAKLAKMNEQYAQLKKETLTRRNQTLNWERELTGKVKSFRDEHKVRQDEEETLRFELKKIQTDFEHLKKIVEQAETEELRAKQRTQALEFELEDYGNMRDKLDAAQDKISTYESQNKELNSLMQQRNELRNDLEIANMRLNSREVERERAMKAYERRILELESRLQSAEKSVTPGQLSPSLQQMVDSVLAQNNSKMTNMKKMYHRLQDQKTELEMQYHELEGEHQALLGRLRNYEKVDYNDPQEHALSRNFSVRSSSMYDSRLPPLTSDVSLSQGHETYTEHQSPTSPISPSTVASPARQPRLDSLARSHMHNYGPDFSRPYEKSLDALFESQNAGTAQSSDKSEHSVETSSSKGEKRDKTGAKPPEVRFYGRGGAQNHSTKKKESRDTKKTEKKTGGFRGLRNIV